MLLFSMNLFFMLFFFAHFLLKKANNYAINKSDSNDYAVLFFNKCLSHNYVN